MKYQKDTRLPWTLLVFVLLTLSGSFSEAQQIHPGNDPSSSSRRVEDNDDGPSPGVPVREWIRQFHRSKQMASKTLGDEDDETDDFDPGMEFFKNYYANKQENGASRNLEQDEPEEVTSKEGGSAPYDVIIVGAGWTGLSAAMTLEAEGITNYVILEATDHIGGRSHTVYEEWEGKSVPLDLGSMWIMGKPNNPIGEIADTLGIPSSPYWYYLKLYKANNQGPYSDDEVNQSYSDYYSNGFLQSMYERRESTESDEPLEVVADSYKGTLSDENKAIVDYYMSSAIEFGYAGLLSEQSLWWWDRFVYFDGLSHFLSGGYGALVEGFAEPIKDKIKTKMKVTKIDYRNRKPTVKVFYDGRKFMEAKQVIVTVPLGALKANTIRFSPKLRRRARRSIQRLGMGDTMNKIFMFWNSDDVFWPSYAEEIGDAVIRENNFSFYNDPSQDTPFLFAFFSGEEMKAIEEEYANSNEALYNEKIRDLAMVPLRNMFGDDIPLPGKVIVTKWNVDEFTRGTYSFNKNQTRKTDRSALTMPLKNRLYLAGEAMMTRYYGSAHGAYFGGKNNAMKVVKRLQKLEEENIV